MAMQVFRCRICGETYLGEECPDKCPFCGVAHSFLVPGYEWTDENANLDLTDISKQNVEAAIELEVGNSRFYLCAAGSAKGKDNELEGMFKRLAKVEREHASLLSKLLRIKVPEIINEPLECLEEELKNISESKARETNAVAHYTQFLAEATEERVRTVFAALVAVEKTHLELDEMEIERIKS